MTANEILKALLAHLPEDFDGLSLAEKTLTIGDQPSLHLLIAGVELQRTAIREIQKAGIVKAQKVVSKYPGRKPAAFSLTQRQQDRLFAALTNGTEDINISRLAKELRISRTTLYRYIEVGPKAAEALQYLKKATGQRYRGSSETSEATMRKAARTFSSGLADAGLKRTHRPVLDEIRAIRKQQQKRRLRDLEEDA